MPGWVDALVREFAAARRALLALDYDGTLKELVARPELAPPSSDLVALLRRVSELRGVELAVISGRPREPLGSWLPDLHLVAEHGLYYRRGGARDWRLLADGLDTRWMNDVRALFESYRARCPGAVIEAKSATLAWHYRQVAPAAAKGAATALVRDIAAGWPHLNIMEGARVIEVRAPGFDKGRAYRIVRDELGPFELELAAGDDRTDEDTFTAATGWTIKLGDGPTRARRRLRDPAEMRALLERLAAARS